MSFSTRQPIQNKCRNRVLYELQIDALLEKDLLFAILKYFSYLTSGSYMQICWQWKVIFLFLHTVVKNIYFQCSVHECGVQEWNIKQVRNFNFHWGQEGKQFPCFYDAEAPAMVILEKTDFVVMLHAVLWPCLGLATGALLWLGLWLGWWSLDHKVQEFEQYSHVHTWNAQFK